MWFVLSKDAAIPPLWSTLVEHCQLGVMHMCPKSQLCCSLTACKLGRLLPAALSQGLRPGTQVHLSVVQACYSCAGISKLFSLRKVVEEQPWDICFSSSLASNHEQKWKLDILVLKASQGAKQVNLAIADMAGSTGSLCCQ